MYLKLSEMSVRMIHTYLRFQKYLCKDLSEVVRILQGCPSFSILEHRQMVPDHSKKHNLIMFTRWHYFINLHSNNIDLYQSVCGIILRFKVKHLTEMFGHASRIFPGSR